jgi:hypothetical protein
LIIYKSKSKSRTNFQKKNHLPPYQAPQNLILNFMGDFIGLFIIPLIIPAPLWGGIESR